MTNSIIRTEELLQYSRNLANGMLQNGIQPAYPDSHFYVPQNAIVGVEPDGYIKRDLSSIAVRVPFPAELPQRDVNTNIMELPTLNANLTIGQYVNHVLSELNRAERDVWPMLANCPTARGRFVKSYVFVCDDPVMVSQVGSMQMLDAGLKNIDSTVNVGWPGTFIVYMIGEYRLPSALWVLPLYEELVVLTTERGEK